MQINRGLVFWGVALITAGAVALAIQSGTVPPNAAREAWRLWPVVLIVIGISIIAARTPLALVTTLLAGLVVGGLGGTLVAGVPDGLSIGCGGEPDESTTTADGSLTDGARVELDFNCGELDVSTAAGDAWSLEARHAGDEPDISSDADGLRIAADGGGWAGFNDARQAWAVTLPAEGELKLVVSANAASSSLDLGGASLRDLTIDANAGSVELDLAGTSVAELSIDANAGSISLNADGTTAVNGSVEMNAGSLELCVPADVSVAITIEDANITFSHNLDEAGLTRQGDTWTGGGGPPAVTLDVDGNAASFTFNPDGGCT